MIQIEVDNSYSRITGLDTEQFSRLRRLLSYEPDPSRAFFGGFKASQRRYLIDKSGVFPTGLIHLLALDWGMPEGVKVIDRRNFEVKRVNLKAKFTFQPYPSQVEAATAAATFKRGTISAPTGSGKSHIIALIIDRIKTPTLVVVPTLEIKRQLSDGLRECFGNSAKHITVKNIDDPSLKSCKDFGLLIVDEGHHVAAKTYHNLNKTAWGAIPYRIFLTATPFRNRDSEQLLFMAIAGSVIYKISYKFAVENKYIVPVEAFYADLPKISTEGYTWAQVYADLVVNNKLRNELISEILINLLQADKSMLCLVKEVKHGRTLSDMTGIPFVCGDDTESRGLIGEFNKGNIKAIIGTTGILGEGVDTKPAEYVVIAGLGKAKSAFMQQVGRGVRVFKNKESAKIILFRDTSHKFTLRHFKEQSKILKEEYGVFPIKLDL